MASTSIDPLAGYEKFTLMNAPDSTIGDSGAESGHARIMQIELSGKVVQQMRDSVRDQKGIHLSFGKNPTVRFGNVTRPLRMSPISCRQEIYRTDSIDAHRLHFSGLVSHKAALEKGKETIAGTDAAIAELKAKLVQHEKERDSNRAEVVENNVKSKSRRLILDRPASKKRQDTSAAKLNVALEQASTGANPKDQAKRFALIHLLAIGSMREAHIVKQTRIEASECAKLLEKLGSKSEGEWKLSDRHYKDLDVWNFPYPSHESRQSAIENAVRSFDRMRISPDDEMWQKLLQASERGRGKTLSKLKINNNFAATPPSTLSSNHRSILKNLGTSHQRSKSKESNLRTNGSDKEDPGKTPKSIPAAAESTKKGSDSSVESSRPAKTTAEKRKSASNPKVKSAEFVYDSDEALASEDESRQKRLKDNQGVARKAPSPARVPSAKLSSVTTKAKTSKSAGAAPASPSPSQVKAPVAAPAQRKVTAPVGSAESNAAASKHLPATQEKKASAIHKRTGSADTGSRARRYEPSPLAQVHSQTNTPPLQVNGSDVDISAPSSSRRSGNYAVPPAARFSLSPKTSRSRGTSQSSVNPDENGYKSSSPDTISPQQLIARRDAAWSSYYELRIASESAASKSPETGPKLWELWREANFWAKEVREAKPGVPELTEHSVPAGSLEFFFQKLKKNRQDRKVLLDAMKARSQPTSDQQTKLTNLDSKIASFLQLCRVAKDAEISARNKELLVDAAGSTSPGSELSRRQTMSEYARFCTMYGKYRGTIEKIRSHPDYPDIAQTELDEEHKMYQRLCELRKDVLDGIFKMLRLFNQDPNGTVTRKGSKDSTTDPLGQVLDQREANTLKWKTRALHHEWNGRLIQALEHFGDVEPQELSKLWDDADDLKRDARKVAKAYALDFGKKDSARLEDLRFEEVWGAKGWEIPGAELESRVNGRV